MAGVYHITLHYIILYHLILYYIIQPAGAPPRRPRPGARRGPPDRRTKNNNNVFRMIHVYSHKK